MLVVPWWRCKVSKFSLQSPSPEIPGSRRGSGLSPAGPGSTGLLAEERSDIRKFTLSASDRLALLFLSQNVSIGLGCTGLPFVSLLKY